MPYEKIGNWAFIVGVIVAIVAGIVSGAIGEASVYIPLILVILGLIVGFLNISDKEVSDFLIAAIALTVLSMSAAGLTVIPVIGGYLAQMVQNVAVFVAPAALVVALKNVWNLASKAV